MPKKQELAELRTRVEALEQWRRELAWASREFIVGQRVHDRRPNPCGLGTVKRIIEHRGRKLYYVQFDICGGQYMPCEARDLDPAE